MRVVLPDGSVLVYTFVNGVAVLQTVFQPRSFGTKPRGG